MFPASRACLTTTRRRYHGRQRKAARVTLWLVLISAGSGECRHIELTLFALVPSRELARLPHDARFNRNRHAITGLPP